MRFTLHDSGKKLYKKATKEELIKIIEDNKVNGWELVGDITYNYSHSPREPWIAVLRLPTWNNKGETTC